MHLCNTRSKIANQFADDVCNGVILKEKYWIPQVPGLCIYVILSSQGSRSLDVDNFGTCAYM